MVKASQQTPGTTSQPRDLTISNPARELSSAACTLSMPTTHQQSICGSGLADCPQCAQFRPACGHHTLPTPITHQQSVCGCGLVGCPQCAQFRSHHTLPHQQSVCGCGLGGCPQCAQSFRLNMNESYNELKTETTPVNVAFSSNVAYSVKSHAPPPAPPPPPPPPPYPGLERDKVKSVHEYEYIGNNL